MRIIFEEGASLELINKGQLFRGESSLKVALLYVLALSILFLRVCV